MTTIINSTDIQVDGLEETFNSFFKNYQITDKLYLEAYHPSRYFLLKGYFGDLKPSFRKYMEMAEQSTDLNDWKNPHLSFLDLNIQIVGGNLTRNIQSICTMNLILVTLLDLSRITLVWLKFMKKD